MISHPFKTVFVHIPKTGGQSIEEVFLARMNLTWEQRDRVLLRANNDPRLGPPRLAHLYAREYVELGYVPKADWPAYLTFSVVRNPWARTVSLFKYRYQPAGMTFDGFLRTIIDWPRPAPRPRFIEPQRAFVCGRDGAVMVDRILRYESLAEEFAGLSLGIFGTEQALPERNVSANRTDYRRFYDDRSVGFVADVYRDDISLFGYAFEAAERK